MRKCIIVLSVLLANLLAPPNLHAQPFSHIAHYITHHKEQLARYSLYSISIGMDVYSSVHCQNVGNRLGGACIETNPLLGRYPSTGKTVGYGVGAIALVIGLDNLVTHFAPNSFDKHIPWIWTAPLAANEFWQYYSNSQATKLLEHPVILNGLHN